MTKEDNECFKNCTKYQICDNDYGNNYVTANYDSHLIMKELGKFSLKINNIPSGLEIHELYYQ